MRLTMANGAYAEAGDGGWVVRGITQSALMAPVVSPPHPIGTLGELSAILRYLNVTTLEESRPGILARMEAEQVYKRLGGQTEGVAFGRGVFRVIRQAAGGWLLWQEACGETSATPCPTFIEGLSLAAERVFQATDRTIPYAETERELLTVALALWADIRPLPTPSRLN
jgi:hypothetical protein